MAAEGYIIFDELGAKLRELDRRDPQDAERELCLLRQRRARIEELERDKTSLLNDFADMVPEAPEELTREERHRLYRMLRLEVNIHPDGDLDIRGAIQGGFGTPAATRLRGAARGVHLTTTW
jgi:hypothetical protein